MFKYYSDYRTRALMRKSATKFGQQFGDGMDEQTTEGMIHRRTSTAQHLKYAPVCSHLAVHCGVCVILLPLPIRRRTSDHRQRALLASRAAPMQRQS